MAYQALKKNIILPGGSGSWISHMGNERACALHPGLIKGCVQRDQFQSQMATASCFKKRPGTEAYIPEVALQKVKYNPLVPKEKILLHACLYSGYIVLTVQ